MRRTLLLSLALPVALFFTTASPSFGQNGPAPGQGKGPMHKNIQVLKDVPPQQLDHVMDFVASSLGVQCNHCHVIDTTGWYMDKDDKPAKNKARKMMQMVMDLNAKNFGGRDAVSCYTCHRGSTEPTTVMALPMTTTRPQRQEQKQESALPTVDDLLAKYENALGGTDAIAKVTSRKMTGVNVDAQGKESPIEIVQAAPGKYLSKSTIREGMIRMLGYNGTKGWMSSPRGVRELPPDASEDMKREASLFPLAWLRERAAGMHVTGKDTANGVSVYRVAAAGTGTTELYYFDAESGLLVRTATMTQTVIGTIPDQTDYMDYRAVSGVKVPYVVRTSAVDPRDGSTHRFVSIEQNIPVEESLFAMPAGK